MTPAHTQLSAANVPDRYGTAVAQVVVLLLRAISEQLPQRTTCAACGCLLASVREKCPGCAVLGREAA